MSIKKSIKIASVLITFLCATSISVVSGQEVKDIEGHVYKTVRIGDRTWITKNLDVSTFNNGEPIPEARTAEEWAQAALEGNPAWCYYNNDTVNGRRYGKLYNWFAVTDPRGLAPEGWRIPSNEDWRVVSKNSGGVDVAGARLKSTLGWKIKDLATNKSGFTGLPAGIRNAAGEFKSMQDLTHWWSTTKDNYSDKVYSLMISDPSPEIKYLKEDKGSGFSVRCVRQ